MAIEIKRRPYKTVFSGNPVHYVLYSSVAATQLGHIFEVRVMFKALGDQFFNPITSDPIQFKPVNGFADVDIQDLLDSVLEFDLPDLSGDANAPTDADRQGGWFYLEYREITPLASDPSWESGDSTNEGYVVKGGLNYFQYGGSNFWVNYFEVEKPFLTWQVNGRQAAAAERVYLTYLNLTGHLNMTVHVRVHNADGSLREEKTKDFATTKGKIHYIPAGCAEWGLDPLDLYYWTVQVKGAGAAESEVFRLELDNRPDYNAITLHYRNSLGGFDGRRVLGVITPKISYQWAKQARKVRPDYYSGNSIDPQSIIHNNKESLVYTGDLGHLSKTEQDRLRDMQLTREVWWEKKGQWVPVNILTNNWDMAKSDESRFHTPIEFTLGYEGGVHYTPEELDLGEGVFTENVCNAYLGNITVTVTTSVMGAEVFVDADEVDPDTASLAFRYRVVGAIGGGFDWQPATYGDLPLSFELPLNYQGTVELQALCGNGMYGKKTTAWVDTSGDSEEPPTEEPANYIFNHTGNGSTFTIYNQETGEAISTGYVGSNSRAAIAIEDGYYSHIRVVMGSISPSYGKLETDNGNTWLDPTRVVGTAVNFEEVEIISGCNIHIY